MNEELVKNEENGDQDTSTIDEHLNIIASSSKSQNNGQDDPASESELLLSKNGTVEQRAENTSSSTSQSGGKNHPAPEAQLLLIKEGTVRHVTGNATPNATDVITTGLLEYMKKKTKGKEILKAYEKSRKDKKPLSKTIRSKLVRLVIEREKDWLMKDIDCTQQLEQFVITKERFEILANEIVYLFEGERTATYYIPFVQEGDFKIPTGGKLWHHYTYEKGRLKQADLLKGKNQITTHIITESETNELEWLSSHIEPWDEVKNKWSESFAARRQILVDGLPIHEYQAQFPCLALQQGKELFFLDFLKIHPGIIFLDEESWKVAKAALIQNLSELRNTKIKSAEELALLHLLQSEEISEVKKNFIVFYLLPFLIPPQRSVKRKRDQTNKDDDARPHRLSLEEVRSSFILKVQTASEVEPALENYKERLRAVNKTFQPVIVAVGSVTNINALYVALNDQLYKVDSILIAIKLSLAIYFSLDCKYPENSQTIWVFLQRLFTTIELRFDVVNVSSNVVYGHIKSLLTSRTDNATN